MVQTSENPAPNAHLTFRQLTWGLIKMVTLEEQDGKKYQKSYSYNTKKNIFTEAEPRRTDSTNFIFGSPLATNFFKRTLQGTQRWRKKD